jgi:hypothetical protein
MAAAMLPPPMKVILASWREGAIVELSLVSWFSCWVVRFLFGYVQWREVVVMKRRCFDDSQLSK